MTTAVAAAISIGSAVAGVAGSAITAHSMKKKMQDPTAGKDTEVKVDEDAALRQAQDMARKRKGYSANILSDATTSTAGAVGGKTALGE